MPATYLVFYTQNARIGSVPNTPANQAAARKIMVLSLIQRDITGTEHYNVLSLRSASRRATRK
jgi:hypothetical protein